jgi:hypothetical protein
MPESSGSDDGPEKVRAKASSLPISARFISALARSATDSSRSFTGAAPVATVKVVPSSPAYADRVRGLGPAAVISAPAPGGRTPIATATPAVAPL